MPRFVVEGYITASVVATVNAENEAEAREKALELGMPSVTADFHQDLGGGDWIFNEWDEFPGEQGVQSVVLDHEQDDEDEGEEK